MEINNNENNEIFIMKITVSDLSRFKHHSIDKPNIQGKNTKQIEAITAII